MRILFWRKKKVVKPLPTLEELGKERGTYTLKNRECPLCKKANDLTFPKQTIPARGGFIYDPETEQKFDSQRCTNCGLRIITKTSWMNQEEFYKQLNN